MPSWVGGFRSSGSCVRAISLSQPEHTEGKHLMSTDELEFGRAVSVSDEPGEAASRPGRQSVTLKLPWQITDVRPVQKAPEDHSSSCGHRSPIRRISGKPPKRGGCSRFSAGPRAAAVGRQAVPQAGVGPGKVDPLDVVARADRSRTTSLSRSHSRGSTSKRSRSPTRGR